MQNITHYDIYESKQYYHYENLIKSKKLNHIVPHRQNCIWKSLEIF